MNDLLSLIGDIDTVTALTSNATRGFAVEDAAAVNFRFTNGALGTFLLCRFVQRS
ncbi:Gfo/Idh/MocA family protein [Mycobacterium sp. URHB0021]